MMANKHENDVGRPLQYETPEALQCAVDQYFDGDAFIGTGEDRMYAPTMSGLALALGLSRQGLLNYQNRDQFVDTLKKARLRVEVALEQRLYISQPTGAIFNLKNNFGWKDKSEHDLTSSDGSMTPKGLNDFYSQFDEEGDDE